MSKYDYIRFGGFVLWADESTDIFRKNEGLPAGKGASRR